jgi:hypothetical protein
MKFKRICSALLVIIFLSTFYSVPNQALGAAPKSEGTVFGGDKLDVGWSICATTDNGYVVTGFTTSFGAGGSDVYIIKYDDKGKVRWDKVIGGPYNDYGYSVAQTRDGGFVVAGTKSSHNNVTDVYLIKLDSDGEVQWEKTYDINGNDEGYSVQQTSDGGYVIAGQTSGGLKSLLIKTDGSGNMNWHKIYGGNFNSAINEVQETIDGGFILIGWIGVSKDNFLDRDVHLIKTGATGEIQWENKIGGNSYDEGSSVRQTEDGGFIITGYTSSYGSGSNDLYLIRTNAAGSRLWENTYGGSGIDVGTSVSQTPDGGFIVSGYTNSYGSGNYDVYVVKTDTVGTKIWEETFGGINDDRGRDLLQLKNGDIIITGQTKSFGNGLDFDVYVLKLERSSVEVKGNYFTSSKKVDVKSTAFHLDYGSITAENVFSAVYDIRDAEGISTGVSGNLTYNLLTESWEALNIDVSDAASELYEVEVTYFHKNGTALSGTGKVISMGALLGISTPYILEGGNLYIYATPFNENGERDPFAKNLEVEITGIKNRIPLNDDAVSGDLFRGDGHYAVWKKITGTGEITVDLYMDDEKVDSATLTVINNPELVILTDVEALYKQFIDTGTQYIEDKDGNKIVDFFDLLERLNKYAAKHRGIVMDIKQEIVLGKGASFEYGDLIYGYLEDADRKNAGILIDEYIARLGSSTGRSIKNIAIIGDDEVVPFYRRIDPLDFEMEYTGPEDMNGSHGNPTLRDSGLGYIMTDIPYASFDNTNPDNVVLPKPDMGIGRIFGVNPNALISSINGYEKPIDLSPSRRAVIFNIKNDNVLWEPVVQKTLVPVLEKHFDKGDIKDAPPYASGKYYQHNEAETLWFTHNFEEALTGANLTMLWTHTNHQSIQAPVKNEGIFRWTIDYMRNSPGHVLLSTGCHSGYSVSHNSIIGNYSMYETALVNSIISKSISYFAPTVYGLGEEITETVTLHDLLQQGFLNNLFSVQNVGQAYVSTYNQYRMAWPFMNKGYATYCAYGMAYYGLPTQPVKRTSESNITKLSENSPLGDARVLKTGESLTTQASSDGLTVNQSSSSILTASVNIPQFDVATAADGKMIFKVPGNNGTQLFNPFAPYVPLINRSFLLPKGAVVNKVSLTAHENSTYQGAVELSTCIPVNRSFGAIEGTPDINDIYPEKLYWYDTSELDGGVLLNLSIVPMEYKAGSKEAVLYNKMNFTIEYSEPTTGTRISSVVANGGRMIEEGSCSIPVRLSVSSASSKKMTLSWKVKDYAGLTIDFGQHEVNLSSGENNIDFHTNIVKWELGSKDLTVWLSDGSETVTAKNTELKVVENTPISTLLRSISISEGTLRQSPYNDKYYFVDLDNSVTTVDLTAVLEDSRASMTINSKQQLSGEPVVLNLSPGTNEVRILISGRDSSENTEYIIFIYREYSDNADLSSLTVTQGTLSPQFDPDITAYTVNVAADITSIGIRPTAAGEGAEIRVNGALVNSGSLRNITLGLGDTNIRISVRAPYGNEKVYNITVKRQVIADNAKLKSLRVTYRGYQYYDMAPVFDPETMMYTVIAYRDDGVNYIIAESDDPGAAVAVSGPGVLKVGSSYLIEPEPGWNQYEVVVTARDGITKKTYSIRLHAAHEGESVPVITYDPVNERYLNVYVKYDGESKESIYGRFIDIYGNPVGDEIFISDSYGVTPRIAYGNGKFFIVWGSTSLKGRIINGDASYGSDVLNLISRVEFEGTPYYEHYYDGSVAYDSTNDRFLVVCTTYRYNGFVNPGSWGIGGMIFNSDGTEYSPGLFVISTPISGTYSYNSSMKHTPIAAYDSSLNRYLVAWTDKRNFINTFPGDIYGQFVNADGTLQGNSPNANFIISGGRGDVIDEWIQDIDYDSNNNRFLVVWKDSDAPEYKGVNIVGRIINSEGTFYGSKFNIAQIPNNSDARSYYIFSMGRSRVNSAFDTSKNRYLVTWHQDRDEIDYNIFGRFIGDDGTAEETFTIANTAHDEVNPSVAYNSKYGCFIIAYESHCETIEGYTQFKRIGCPPAPSVIQFSEAVYSVSESAGSIMITVTRSSNIESEVSVFYRTSDGTASAGDDYTEVAGTLIFRAGETTKTFSVPIIDDSDVEENETIMLSLTDLQGSVLGERGTAVIVIIDDDVPGETPGTPEPTPEIPSPTPGTPEPTPNVPTPTPGSPTPTPRPVETIPKTGAVVDARTLISFGLILVSCGIVILRRRKKKNTV